MSHQWYPLCNEGIDSAYYIGLGGRCPIALGAKRRGEWSNAYLNIMNGDTTRAGIICITDALV